ncbi:hypothetical protein SGLAM104S_03614 [Streptomyces glaucescens]
MTSYAAAAMHEYREHGDPAVLTQALATVTRLTAPGAPHTDDSRVLSTLADLLLAHSEVDRGGGLDRAEATARRALETAHAPADRRALSPGSRRSWPTGTGTPSTSPCSTRRSPPAVRASPSCRRTPRCPPSCPPGWSWR